MNQYVTGRIIKEIREKQNMTQQDLAKEINVSDKTISKWETGRGLPDISLLEPLAKALHVSIIELLNGYSIQNTNQHANIKQMHYYVCPICHNIITSIGESMISCCGITLPSLISEQEDEEHIIHIERVEDEYYVYMNHEMTKDHYISFIIAMKDDGYEFVKLYPEGRCEARFKRAKVRKILFYCTQHGLYEKKP